MLIARDDEERRSAEALGYDFTRVLTTDDLVSSDNCFFAATAITDGDFLRGVRFTTSARPRSRWSCVHVRAR